jgi:hypothetical protein
MDRVRVGLSVVVTSVADGAPRLAVVRSSFALPRAHRAKHDEQAPKDALPGAPLDLQAHTTLQTGLRRVAEDLTGLSLRYVEQLYTFGDRFRDPYELFGGQRSIVVAYLALVRHGPLGGESAAWRSVYDYFPWEDWRADRPALIDAAMRPALEAWIIAAESAAVRDRRAERIALAFGESGGDWDAERVLERYELLFEAGLVEEARRDADFRARAAFGAVYTPPPGPVFGRAMARDGRRIVACALERLRGKLKYRPIVFELLEPSFTLHRLQQVVEALNGARLHKQNFRRLVLNAGLVEPTGQVENGAAGRPAELFRYRPAAIHERTSAHGLREEEG